MWKCPNRSLATSIIALAIAATIWLVPAPASGAAAPEPLNIYVSPEGSDQYTGTQAHNNHEKTDGPVATLLKVREMIRQLKGNSGGKLTRPINVLLRGGTYWLVRPLELTPDDSGTADCPITWSAFENEKPVISAGRPIRGWSRVSLNGREMWAANVPQFKDAQDSFREMWVNGQRRVMARSPNTGFFKAQPPPEVTAKTGPGNGQSRFVYQGEDLKSWPDASEADVVLMTLWAESHLPVKSIDENEHLIEFTRPTIHKMSADDRYYIEGATELLDEPGEWCFERKTGTLYYLPMPGDEIITGEIVVPWFLQVMRLEGAPQDGQFVEHLIFRGITFANSEWNVPRGKTPVPGMNPAGFSQAAVGVPGAVWGEGVHDCVFDNCTITRAGNYGLELGRGCLHNKISYCALTDLGAGGIKLGETKARLAEAEQARGNEISDCTIADCGKTFPSAIGIWLGQTQENLVTHNDIHGLWYTGISVGWTWGYGNSLAQSNIIEFNHVHHIGTPAAGIEPILSDMGGIYTLGKSPGTIVRNNCFHDIAGLRYGGWGIYFDEGTSNILAENNLVYRTTHGGFHQHYGADNIVRNNIFALGRDAQIKRSRIEDHTSFTFERNIVYWDQGALLAGDWSKLNVVFDHNTYWHVGGEDFKFGKQTWEQWQAAGMDEHSQKRDPGFLDPSQSDFRLKDGAEKELDGFVRFDVSTIGPRPRK